MHITRAPCVRISGESQGPRGLGPQLRTKSKAGGTLERYFRSHCEHDDVW